MISEYTIMSARSMRAEGSSWRKIGRDLGVHYKAIRRRTDPAFDQKCRENEAGRARSGRRLSSDEVRTNPRRAANADPVPPAYVLAEREDYLRQEHADATSLLLGDPRPGRRSLDRKNGSGSRLALRPYNVFIMGAPAICVKSS